MTYASSLGGGLRVIVLPDRRAPIVAVHLAIPAGAHHDVPGRTGLAHLTEHMMFTGSARGYAADVQSRGGRFTATTSFQRTTYAQTVPSGELEHALAVEATRLHRVPRELEDGDVAVQREVVAGERRRRHTSRPYGTALPRLFRLAHRPGDPAANLPLGRPDDVAALTADDCRAFLRQHYRAAGTILTLAGDTDPETAMKLAGRHFGDFGGSPPPPPAAYDTVTRARGEWQENAPAEGLFALIRLPAEGDPAFPGAATAVRIAESRLNDSLTEAGMITEIRLRVIRLGAGATMASLRAIAAPGVRAVAVEEHVRETIGTLATCPAGEQELARARAWEWRDQLDQTATLAGWADETSRTAMFLDPATPGRDTKRVSADDVAAATWPGDEWAATLRCLPGLR